MSLSVDISFHNMMASDALRASIEEHAARLEAFADDILFCHVVVEPTERRHHQGNRYRVHVHLALSGGTIDAGKTPDDDHSHEDAYVAVRDAFDSARRQLEDFVRRRRGDVKHHETPETGHIHEIDYGAGIGLIMSSDGQEIPFHRNSVVDVEFEKLTEGSPVSFVSLSDLDGLRATTVHRLSHRPHSISPITSSNA